MSGEPSSVGLDATLRDFSGGQKVFNRYTLIKTLGRGGMGIVWLAHDEVLDRDVALKFLPEIIIHDRAVLEDLKHETKRSLELTHKNIVRIHDFVHDIVSGCISMEYVEGDTLSNLRADKPSKVFEPDELKPWLRQLCEALDYAHNHARIVHRDLKPSNLMISKRSQLKVADFGIARSLSDSVSMLTHARGTSGTLVYMSPQQLDGERGTHLDDIYSLGATIYELLTSKPPFYSGDVSRQIHERIPPSMMQRRGDLEIEGNPIPRNWEDTVAVCLAKDPTKRPQSVAEIASRLELTGQPIAVIAKTSNRTKQNTLLAVAATAAVVAAAVLIIVFLRRPISVQERTQSNQPTATAEKKPSQQDSGAREATTFDTTTAPIPPSDRIPPRPKGYFADYAGVVSADAAARFNEQLAQFERETSNQVVVAIYLKMESTAPIDGYTRRIANAWGVGQARRQNGVLLFVFVKDKKMFMQVGEGLEDVLSNSKAFDITERQIKPHFRSANYEGGINEGISAIFEATRARYRGNGKTAAEAADQEKAEPNEQLFKTQQANSPSEPIVAASTAGRQSPAPGSESIVQPSAATATAAITVPSTSNQKSAALLPSATLNFAAVTKEKPYENSLGMKFVPVAGSHLLFSIWDTRVRDYETFTKETNRQWKKPSFRQTPSDPAVNVSWEDSRAFCVWLTEVEQKAGRLNSKQWYRLPTDAEWSLAAGDTKYPWGNQWPPPRGSGNYSPSLHVDDYEFTSPVGSFPPNATGLYDMGGNVWQWCEDWYRKEMNSKAVLDHDPSLKKYADGKTLRVVRGGSYYVGAEIDLESSIRVGGGSSNGRNGNNGFRCVLSESQ